MAKWRLVLLKPCGASIGRAGAWALLVFAAFDPFSLPAADTASRFRADVQPILTQYCYDCHADGESKGGIAFDELKPDGLTNHDLWLKVIKNVRAELMPPQKKARPTAAERKRLEDWIKYDAFGIDPKNIDPGRVTVRRLNRAEYSNTIGDLMDVDFNADIEFPPDDTGYGFDNIGDVLTVSPMLLEKYLDAAKSIVTEGIPVVSRVPAERIFGGSRFRTNNTTADAGPRPGRRNRPAPMLSLPFNQPAAIATSFRAENPGRYQLIVQLGVKGEFNHDDATCRVSFKADGHELLQKEFGWEENKTFRFEYDQQWQPGEHRLAFDVQPVVPPDEGTNTLQLRILSVTVRGAMEKESWVKPPNYERFFPKDPPATVAERKTYAREVLGSFTRKAFRRPVDTETVDRLVALAEGVYTQPGKSFEMGFAHAAAAVLASPRFLFRIEESGTNVVPGSVYPLVDEYSLASRLSYLLWTTMPDDELMRLADRGELRKNLPAQVKRMLADSRSEMLVENFTGQWLQTRDVDGISINAREVLARDAGEERELKRAREQFIAEQAIRNSQTNNSSGTNQVGRGRGNNRQRAGFLFRARIQLDGELRTAMKRETQMTFSTVVREDRSLTELIASDYTFLNEKLAGFYGLTNLNVTGREMRRVALPPDSPRGGILTHGSVLVVTSNPDRTSPVKRGLFVLSNILGTPAPPPPGNVPALEVVDRDFKDKAHDPTLREALALHRESPQCASCHKRMDPIGLAFENFNAMGMWREKERNQVIDAAGQLITGESFNSVRELKQILTHQRRADFYRCFTEKLLTYALGRGVEYYDTETVDLLVQRLEQNNGRFLPLLTGIIESAPFQKQRVRANAVTAEAGEPLPSRVEVKEPAETEASP